MANNDDTSDTTSGGIYYTVSYSDCTSSCTTSYSSDGSFTWTIRVPPPRKLLVKVPKHWKKSRIDGFAGLVNDETQTGWKVTMLVKVERLYDKTVERVTMEEFKAILMSAANAADQQLIIGFFKRR